MAAGNQTTLKVDLLPGNQKASVELTSSSPDLDRFVGKIVEYKEKIDVEKITVECDDEKFDVSSFREIVTESVRDFLEKVALEQQTLEKVIADLENQSDK